MTYRTGNHQPQNIYRDDRYIGVMFTAETAAEVVAAMNAHTPDVDHTRGAAEALTHVRRQLDAWLKLHPLHDGRPAYATVVGMLRVAAAELGVDEDAPSARVSSPQSAQNASGVAECTPDALSGSEGVCDCGHDGLDEMFHLRPCPIAERRNARLRADVRRRCICNDPPPTVDKPKNGTATRPPGWACPRHGQVI